MGTQNSKRGFSTSTKDVRQKRTRRKTKEPKEFEASVLKQFDRRIEKAFFAPSKDEELPSRDKIRKKFMGALQNSELLTSVWSSSYGTSKMVQALVPEAIPIFYKAGDVLFEANTYGQILYVIISGEMQVSTRLEDQLDRRGKSVNSNIGGNDTSEIEDSVETQGSGTVLADYSLLMKVPHVSTVVGKKAGLLLAIHRLQYQVVAMRVSQNALHSNFRRGSSPSELYMHLCTVPIFSTLTEEQRKKLAKKFKSRRYVPGERIVRSGNAANAGLYIILSGEVGCRTPSAVFTSGKVGPERKKLFADDSIAEVSWLRPGDHFGEAALLEDTEGATTTGVTFVASEELEVNCLVLPKDDFLEFVSAQKEDGAPLLDLIRHVHVSRLIQRNPLFGKLSDADVRHLSANCKRVTFMDQQDVTTVLNESRVFFLVIHGAIKMLTTKENSDDDDDVVEPVVIPDEINVSTTPPVEDKKKRPLRKSIGLQFRRSTLERVKQGISRRKSKLSPKEIDEIKENEESSKRPTLDRPSSLFEIDPDVMENVFPASQQSKVFDKVAFMTEDTDDTKEEVEEETPEKKNIEINDNWAVLLGGDVFGEEILLKDKNEPRNSQLEYISLGKSSCLCITMEMLESLELGSALYQSLTGEDRDFEQYNDDDNESVISTVSHASRNSRGSVKRHSKKRSSVKRLSKAKLRRSKKSLPKEVVSSSVKALRGAKGISTISNKYLALHKMLHQSFQTANSRQLALTMRRSHMASIKPLHSTDMTNVWLAKHSPTGQLCVLKSTNISVANAKGAGQFIFTEPAVMSQLSSQFTMQLLASWEEPRNMLVALEPVMGGDMEQLIDSASKLCRDGESLDSRYKSLSVGDRGCLTFKHSRFFAACVTLALKHLYEHRVCHRDIKPCNIMIDHRGYFKLADFGIAKQFLSGSNRTFTSIGTPNYMAPEVLNFAGYGSEVDWWSFGATLFEAAVGFNPFEMVHNAAPLSFTVSRYRILEYFFRCRQTKVEAGGSLAKELLKDEIFQPLCTNYDSDAIKKRSRASQEKWSVFGDFVAGLMSGHPYLRYGSDAFHGGPRGAINHELFAGDSSIGLKPFDWAALNTRRLRSPYRPDELIMDLDVVENISLDTQGTSGDRVPPLRRALKRDKPKLARSIDTEVRDVLETDRNGFMKRSLNEQERNRRNMMLNYRSNAAISNLKSKDAGIDSKLLAAKVLKKATVAETMHQVLAGVGAMKRRVWSSIHQAAAVTIQRIVRGVSGRKKAFERKVELRGQIHAAIVIQRHMRKWLEKKRLEEGLTETKRKAALSNIAEDASHRTMRSSTFSKLTSTKSRLKLPKFLKRNQDNSKKKKKKK